MARRGAELREHILFSAKDVFLEHGFAGASMDLVAVRAETSKRSLYAHFASKDALFLAVVDLVRELYLGRLGTPSDYSDDLAEAAVLFCGRFVQLLLWTPAMRTCRLTIGEAERLPEAAARYYDAIFEQVHVRLAEHLGGRGAVAQELVATAVHPTLTAALLGVAPTLAEPPDAAHIERDVDLAATRRVAASALR